MRQFHPATFCLIIATVGIVLSGCSVETTRPETVIPEWIIGATMEEVIEMEGDLSLNGSAVLGSSLLFRKLAALVKEPSGTQNTENSDWHAD